ncbi:MAG TPA: SDR family oxidoreductase [Dehalococcoidia bacterium]|jgi:NAD(P)-dependent dehydrogenase (short-subunit alcohol dehydrogenase family)|nr:SDR family oxidoreductase [Dehalococcoidia bacterium]
MGERLKDKVAIVTGAGSILAGIGNGKATAIVFAREGAKVMAVDYNLEAAEETRRLIEEEGGECVTFKVDVSKASDCEKMVQACLEKFGRIDILHNNVGMGGYGGPVETSEEIWDKMLTINLKSMFLTCKYVLPHMERQGSGVIINISSLNAIRAQPSPAVAYACSKAGVVALTREVALQYAAKGIRCNAILPGLMKTPMVEFYNPDAYGDGDVELMWRRRDAMSPTGKQGEPWDVAYAALFLASDEAKYITGTTLLVDGGIAGTIRGW